MDYQQRTHHHHHQKIIPPPSPPSSSITDDEKFNTAAVTPLLDDSTTHRLQTCFGNIDQAQHHLKSQQRVTYLRSVSEPSPSSLSCSPQQQSKSLIDIHRLAIEALQNLYAEERRRNEYLEEQAERANEEIIKLQQEVSRQKQARHQEQRELQEVYGLVDTVRDVSSTQKRQQQLLPKPSCPEDLHIHLRHILTNITTLHHHPPPTGSLVVDLPEYDPYFY
ncbi:hypothetical protein BDA99DRAFT_520131 [Phascolomyces articulosus]|uniref:Uncharacterized protein n=1 Tax=Phascolomyces articulosus TaxID=60185 RepID=A0AAD5K2Y6_9FUNG|nr:hypothetical protein BDA99DRAFT_520131 [Phascolomyces articulosus]